MTYDALDYGAVGDGKTLNTGALQNAVDAAARQGGTVCVPPGTFLTGTVELKSGVTLELAAGAKVLGSPDLSDYAALERVISGEAAPPFSALWAGNVEGVVEAPSLPGSTEAAEGIAAEKSHMRTPG